MNHQIIYCDNNATTKVDNRVLDSMLPFFSEMYGNASSKLHAFGWQAEAAVDKAKQQIADLINAEPDEIIFTSGATESVNLAIKGIYEAYRTKGNHIITVCTEHKAVLDTCFYLEEMHDAKVTCLNVDREGLIDIEELMNSFTDKTILVSIMAANNETGVIQDIERIAQLCKERKVIFFTDATQYVGKMHCDVKELGVHCMAFSAHKIYGPKGIGALYVRRMEPRVNLIPQIHGGGQQSNKRSGTLNVPLIVGFGMACELAKSEYWDNNTHVSKLRNYFEHQLLEINGLRINGSTRTRLYNTSNITFPYKLNVKQLLTNFAFSNGSSCASGTNEPSHVLIAMKLDNEEILNSFRFSFGKYNTLDEIKSLINEIMSSKQT